MRQCETHKLRHVITQLLDYVPEEVKSDPLVKELTGYSCKTRTHVVRLLAPRLDNESHTKDIDFSPVGICKRWEAGYPDTVRALTWQPWIGEFGPLDVRVFILRGLVRNSAWKRPQSGRVMAPDSSCSGRHRRFEENC
jgi:hypothetical protein